MCVFVCVAYVCVCVDTSYLRRSFYAPPKLVYQVIIIAKVLKRGLIILGLVNTNAAVLKTNGFLAVMGGHLIPQILKYGL